MKKFIIEVCPMEGYDEPTYPSADDIEEALEDWGHIHCKVKELNNDSEMGCRDND